MKIILGCLDASNEITKLGHNVRVRKRRCDHRSESCDDVRLLALKTQKGARSQRCRKPVEAEKC